MAVRRERSRRAQSWEAGGEVLWLVWRNTAGGRRCVDSFVRMTVLVGHAWRAALLHISTISPQRHQGRKRRAGVAEDRRVRLHRGGSRA